MARNARVASRRLDSARLSNRPTSAIRFAFCADDPESKPSSKRKPRRSKMELRFGIDACRFRLRLIVNARINEGKPEASASPVSSAPACLNLHAQDALEGVA